MSDTDKATNKQKFLVIILTCLSLIMRWKKALSSTHRHKAKGWFLTCWCQITSFQFWCFVNKWITSAVVHLFHTWEAFSSNPDHRVLHGVSQHLQQNDRFLTVLPPTSLPILYSLSFCLFPFDDVWSLQSIKHYKIINYRIQKPAWSNLMRMSGINIQLSFTLPKKHMIRLTGKHNINS